MQSSLGQGEGIGPQSVNQLTFWRNTCLLKRKKQIRIRNPRWVSHPDFFLSSSPAEFLSATFRAVNRSPGTALFSPRTSLTLQSQDETSRRLYRLENRYWLRADRARRRQLGNRTPADSALQPDGRGASAFDGRDRLL